MEKQLAFHCFLQLEEFSGDVRGQKEGTLITGTQIREIGTICTSLSSSHMACKELDSKTGMFRAP
jgi:hypothetical protein